MPKEVHDCVDKLLAQEDFYPDKDQKERESIAWATCNKQHKADSTIEFESVNTVAPMELFASEEGRMLVFRNADLCYSGENANKDGVPDEEIDNLVSTAPGSPIDWEHKEHNIHGMFTNAKVGDKDGVRSILVDGIIWSSRYPKSAEGIRNGELKLSIEASGESATCSVCGGEFRSRSEYCQHISSLASKRTYGATRWVHGLTCVGGALTENPAFEKAGFADANIIMVASHGDQEEVDMGDTKEIETQLQAAKARNDELEATLKQLQENLAALTGEKTTLAEQVATLTAKLEKANASLSSMVEASRKAAMSPHLSDEDWNKQREVIMAMSEEAFALMASVAKSKVEPPKQQELNVRGGLEPENVRGNREPENPVDWQFD